MPRIAILGAGPSGLVSAKSALEYGLEPVIFEKEAWLGGLWSPTTGSTWQSMRTNLSRFTCMFSDFPWDKNSEVFPSQSDVQDYLEQYARTFELIQHIRFNCNVANVKREGDKWCITWNEENGVRLKTEKFEYLIVATGIFSKPYTPDFKGMENFKGTVIHGKYYKSSEQFKNKSVAVVGSSFSATEIAADIGRLQQK